MSTKKRILNKILSALLISFVFVFALVLNTEVNASTNDTQTEKIGLGIENTIMYDSSSYTDVAGALTYYKGQLESYTEQYVKKDDLGVQLYFQILYIRDYYLGQIEDLAMGAADLADFEALVQPKVEEAKKDIANYIYDWAVDQAKTELKHAAATLQVSFTDYDSKFVKFANQDEAIKTNPDALRDAVETVVKDVVYDLACDALANQMKLAKVELVEYAALNGLISVTEAKDLAKAIQNDEEVLDAPKYYSDMVDAFKAIEIVKNSEEDQADYIKAILECYQDQLVEVETELILAKGEVTLLSAKNDAIKLLDIYASVLQVEMKPEYEQKILDADVDTVESTTFEVMELITNDAKSKLHDKIFTEERKQSVELLKMYAQSLGVEFKQIYHEMIYAAGVTADNLRDVISEVKSFIENDAKDLAYEKVLEESKKLTVKLLKLYAQTAQVEYQDSYTVRIYDQETVSAVEAESEVIMGEINDIVKANLENKVLQETKEASIKIIKLYADTLTVEWKTEYEDRINAATFDNLQSVLMGVKADIDSEAKDVAYNIVLEQTKKYTIKLIVLYTSTLGVEYDQDFTRRINEQTTVNGVENEFMTIKSEIDAYVASKLITTAKEEAIEVLKIMTVALGLTWNVTHETAIMAAETVEELKEITANIKNDLIEQGKEVTVEAARTNAIRILKLYASSLHATWDKSWEDVINNSSLKGIDDAIMTVKSYIDSQVKEMALDIARDEATSLLQMLAEILGVEWKKDYDDAISMATSIEDLTAIVKDIKNRFFAESKQEALDLAHTKTISLLMMYASALHVDWKPEWEAEITGSSLLELDSAILKVKGYIDEIAISDVVEVTKENTIKVLSLLAETLGLAWDTAYDAKILAAQTKAEVETAAKEIKDDLIAQAKNITVSTARKYALQAMNLYASTLHVKWDSNWDSIINNSHIEDLDQAMFTVKDLIDAVFADKALAKARAEVKSTIDMLCKVLGVAYDSGWNTVIDMANDLEDLMVIADDIKAEIYAKAYNTTLEFAQDKAYNLLKMYANTVGITDEEWNANGWTEEIYDCDDILVIDEVIYNIISEINEIVANSALQLAQDKAITVMKLYASTLQVEWLDTYEELIDNSTVSTLEDAVLEVKSQIDAAATNLALDVAKENALKALKIYAKVAGVREWNDDWTKTINDVTEVRAMDNAIEKVINEITLVAKENALSTVQMAALAILKLYADSVNVEIKPEWIDMIKDAVVGDLQSVISEIKELINEEVENRKNAILLETYKKTAISILNMYYGLFDKEVPQDLIDAINSCTTPEQVELLLGEFIDEVIVDGVLDKSRETIISGLQIYADTLRVEWNPNWSQRIMDASDLVAEIKAVKSEIDSLAKENITDTISNKLLGHAKEYAILLLKEYHNTLGSLGADWNPDWEVQINACETIDAVKDKVLEIKGEIEFTIEPVLVDKAKEEAIKVLTSYANTFGQDELTTEQLAIINSANSLTEVYDAVLVVKSMIDENAKNYAFSEVQKATIKLLEVYAQTFGIELTEDQKNLILNANSIGEIEDNAIIVKDQIEQQVKDKLLDEAKDAAITLLEEFGATVLRDENYKLSAEDEALIRNAKSVAEIEKYTKQIKNKIVKDAETKVEDYINELQLDILKANTVASLKAFADIVGYTIPQEKIDAILNAIDADEVEALAVEIRDEIKEYASDYFDGALDDYIEENFDIDKLIFDQTKASTKKMLEVYAETIGSELTQAEIDAIDATTTQAELDAVVDQIKDRLVAETEQKQEDAILDQTKDSSKKMLEVFAEAMGAELTDEEVAKIENAKTQEELDQVIDEIKDRLVEDINDKQDEEILDQQKNSTKKMLEVYAETMGAELTDEEIAKIENAKTQEELDTVVEEIKDRLVDEISTKQDEEILDQSKDSYKKMLEVYAETMGSELTAEEIAKIENAKSQEELDTVVDEIKDRLVDDVNAKQDEEILDQSKDSYKKMLEVYAETMGSELTAEEIAKIENAKSQDELDAVVEEIKDRLIDDINNKQDSEILDQSKESTKKMLDVYAETLGTSLTAEEKALIDNAKTQDELDQVTETIKNRLVEEANKKEDELLLDQAKLAAVQEIKIYCVEHNIEFTETLVEAIKDATNTDEVEAALDSAKEKVDAIVEASGKDDGKLADLREQKQEEITQWLFSYLEELTAKIEAGELVFKAKLSAKQTSVENQLRAELSKIYTEENVDLILSYYKETMTYLELATTEAEINAALLSFQNKVMGLTNAITGSPQGYALDYVGIALLSVIAILIIVLIVFVAKKDKQPIIVYGNTSSEPETIEEEVEEPAEEVVEEVVEEEVQEEVQEEPAEEVVEEVQEEPEDDNDEEETEETVEETPAEEVVEVNDAELSTPREKRYVKPFKNRILEANELTQEFYSTIKNELCSYRKVRARMSKSCESFRISRDLQAKLVMSSTTLKLYLALNPQDFNQKIYFQKDVSHKKKYAEVPLMMRLKSRRSVKRSIDLIGTLMANKQVTKRPRYVERDYVQLLKEQEQQNNENQQ